MEEAEIESLNNNTIKRTLEVLRRIFDVGVSMGRPAPWFRVAGPIYRNSRHHSSISSGRGVLGSNFGSNMNTIRLSRSSCEYTTLTREVSYRVMMLPQFSHTPISIIG